MTSRVVFDCMVFLQGAGRPMGPAGAVSSSWTTEKYRFA